MQGKTTTRTKAHPLAKKGMSANTSVHLRDDLYHCVRCQNVEYSVRRPRTFAESLGLRRASCLRALTNSLEINHKPHVYAHLTCGKVLHHSQPELGTTAADHRGLSALSLSKILAVYANSPGHLTLSQDPQAIAAKPAINQLRRHIGTPYMVCKADSFP
jgi:hypothetical protein